MNPELFEELKTVHILTQEQAEKVGTQLGVKDRTDMEMVSEADLVSCGILPVPARKIVAAYKSVPVAAASSATGIPALGILPAAPDDGNLLEMLKVGGVLKIGEVEVISAVRAGLADLAGLYDIPDRLMARIDQHLEEQEVPAGEAYFEIQKAVNEKKYGDVLSVIKVSANYVSESRKKQFLERVRNLIWPSLHGFHGQLKAWQEAYMTSMGNPAAMMEVLRTVAGAPGGASMMTAVDTSGLRASAEEVINQINRAFAGPGIPVARALAADGIRLKAVLERADVVAEAGYTARDQLLKGLGLAASADLVRAEPALVRFALGVMALPKTAADNEQLYIGALFQVGASIPWEALLAATAAGGHSARAASVIPTGGAPRDGRRIRPGEL